MDLTHIFLIAVVFLLAHVEAKATFKPKRRLGVSMLSSYRRDEGCSGGNLLKIHLHKCTGGLCKAKLDGPSTSETKSIFRIIKINATGKRCIEFRDNTNNKYALKVVNSTRRRVAFERRGCNPNISDEFQFQEDKTSGNHFVYIYNISNNFLCLGVDAKGCDATLKLITTNSTIEGYDRRCFFNKL